MNGSKVLARISPSEPWGSVDWPDEMAWISDLRSIDAVKSAMLDRIDQATSLKEQIKISRYCDEVSQAFAFLSLKALKGEHK